MKKKFGEGISRHKYSQIISSLCMLLTTLDRTMGLVGRLSRYAGNPLGKHQAPVEIVFCYKTKQILKALKESNEHKI